MENKKSVIIILALLVFVFFASLVVSKTINRIAERDRKEPEQTETGTGTENVSDNSFELAIIKEANKDNKENYLISPYSIKIALNMLKDGADKETYKQIEKVLGDSKINNLSDDTVSLANGIFVKDSYKEIVEKEYINKLTKDYKADVVFDKFENSDKINNWVNEKTKNMIPILLEDLDSDFVLALVNALAIDVKWEREFKCDNTSEEDFKKVDGSTTKVAMMHDYSSNGKYFKTDSAKGIILPYKGDEDKGLELVAILPNDDISSYVNKLDEEEIKKIDDYELKSDTKIRLSLPKFTYDYDWETFMTALQDMGIQDVFNPGKADLSKMLRNAKNGEFYVSQAIHKTHIELDEKGTKAAAVTGFVISKNAMETEEVIEMKFDKPFVYIIRDKVTKEIIFFGAVYEPNKWEGNDCDGDEK